MPVMWMGKGFNLSQETFTAAGLLRILLAPSKETQALGDGNAMLRVEGLA